MNVQGIRNKTGEIIKGLEELKQDIAVLTETRKKGNGVEILGSYTFIVEFQKKKGQSEEYLFSLKRDIRDILRLGRHYMKI